MDNQIIARQQVSFKVAEEATDHIAQALAGASQEFLDENAVDISADRFCLGTFQ